MRVVERGAIAAVVAASPIAQVAAEYGLGLIPLGPCLLGGRCPFHEVPIGRSLLVTPDTQRFACLACTAAGDVVGLVMRLEGASLLVALAHLARRAGLSFDALFPEWSTGPVEGDVRPALSPARLRVRPRRSRSTVVPEWALTPPSWLRPVPGERGR